jgi:hypothetical protein
LYGSNGTTLAARCDENFEFRILASEGLKKVFTLPIVTIFVDRNVLTHARFHH